MSPSVDSRLVILIGLSVICHKTLAAGEKITTRQNQIDEDWLQRYNAIFIEGQGVRSYEEMVDTLNRLYNSHRLTSQSTSIEPLGREVRDLVEISFTFTMNCNDKSFRLFDGLTEKYSNGFSKSILDYIQFHRSKLWEICKQSFMICLRPSQGLSGAKRIEMMSLVDHIWAAYPKPTVEPWSIDDLDLMEPGIVDYIRDKLGKKRAHKLKNIEQLIATEMKPICNLMNFVFAGRDKFGEIIKNRVELRREFSLNDLKWLTAIKVCGIILRFPLQIKERAHQILDEQHREARSNSCLGKLLCQGR